MDSNEKKEKVPLTVKKSQSKQKVKAPPTESKRQGKKKVKVPSTKTEEEKTRFFTPIQLAERQAKYSKKKAASDKEKAKLKVKIANRPVENEAKVLVPIANEIDALESVVLINVLRRANAIVTVASVENELQINSSTGVKIVADTKIAVCENNVFDLIALPGGPGVKRLAKCEILESIVRKHQHSVAFCAYHDTVFGSWGLSEEQSPSTRVERDSDVSPTAIECALAVVEHLYGKEMSAEISKELIVGSYHGDEDAILKTNPVEWCQPDITPKILVPVASGTEEMEALFIIDALRRAGAQVVVASIAENKQIVGSRKVVLEADVLLHDVRQSSYDLIVMPDEIGGLKAFHKSTELIELLKNQMKYEKPYGAIGSCPAFLNRHGLLMEKKATIYPSLCGQLINSSLAKYRVVIDGFVATGQGVGLALEFALALVEKFYGEEKAENIAKDMAKDKLVIMRSRNQYKAMASNPNSSPGLHFEDVISASTLDADEYIHIVGGYNGSSVLKDMSRYCPPLNHIEHLPPMITARHQASAAVARGHLYVIGGRDGDFWSDIVEAYNLESFEWNSLSSLNRKKGGLASVSILENVYAIGGSAHEKAFSDVEMLDLSTGKWTMSKPMQHERSHPAVAYINGSLYVCGGYDGHDFSRSVERFDPREHKWAFNGNMISKRSGHSVLVRNEKLCALGGYDGTQMVPTIEEFDPRIGLWMMKKESMNVGRGYFGAVALGEKIYVIGGVNDKDDCLESVECYQDGQGWELIDSSVLGKRSYFSAFIM